MPIPVECSPWSRPHTYSRLQHMTTSLVEPSPVMRKDRDDTSTIRRTANEQQQQQPKSVCMSGRDNWASSTAGRGRGGARRGGGGRGGSHSRGVAAGSRGASDPPEGGRTGGRGRGRGRAEGNRNGSRGQGRSHRVDGEAKPADQLKNGEKGAEAHTVSETDRITFTKILMTFREGDETTLEFPPTLTNTERKFVHLLASQLGLVSKSSGKDTSRRIAVTKRPDKTRKMGTSDSDLPTLTIGKQGMLALQKHIQAFPPSHFEELESKETGASLVAALGGGPHEDADLADTLRQLGLGQEQRTELEEFKPRFVDLDRRRARHAAFQDSKKKSPHYASMMAQRSNLPAFSRQQEIIEIVARSPVTIIQGETGCGKSTQVCQSILGEVNATMALCPLFGDILFPMGSTVSHTHLVLFFCSLFWYLTSDSSPTANIVVTQREWSCRRRKLCIVVCIALDYVLTFLSPTLLS